MIKLKTKSERREKKSALRRIIITITGLLLISGIFAVYCFYTIVMSPNTRTSSTKGISLYIPTGASFEQVIDSLCRQELLIDKNSFVQLAQWRGYHDNIKSGHYVIKNAMTNLELLRLLRGGIQTPIRVTFNNMRDIEQVAGRVATQIEADSASISMLLHDDNFISKMGFNSSTIPCLFLPNTYELYWNTDAEEFVSRMFQEYRKFWNEERRNKAKLRSLSPEEVSILASIVDKETNKADEMPQIAGVYLNRLKSKWLLQADPTLVYAIGDFTIKRVLDIHKEIDSPYNTYKNVGLPPGPICIPSLAAINAVLDAENHNFYYFCAKEDMSGYHNFAKTLSEHQRNAAKYQRELNKMRIWK